MHPFNVINFSFSLLFRAKIIRNAGTLMVLLVLFAMIGSACFSNDIPEYSCSVIDPSDMFGYNGAINALINEGIKDINNDNRYDIAVSSFDSAAGLADADDDRDFIAKNNLGCVLLKQAALSSISSAPTFQKSIALSGLAFVGSPLLVSLLPSTSGVCNEKLQESYNLLAANFNDRYNEDDDNFKVLDEIIRKIRCATPMHVAIKITRPNAPKAELLIALPSNIFNTIISLNPVIGGKSYGLLQRNNPIFTVPLPSEGAYCYELSAESRNSSYPLKGSGVIFIDSKGASLDNFVKSYTVIVVDPATVDLINTGNKQSIALYATFSDPAQLSQAEIIITAKGQQYRSIELSYEDRREAEEIPISPSNGELAYKVKLNGKIVKTGIIKNVSNGDVFRLNIDRNSVFLQRRTCDDGELIDLDYAIKDLAESVKSGDDAWINRNLATALLLTDPPSPDIAVPMWIDLCWWGALSRHATEVVDDACQMAVQTAKASADPQLIARAHGSRGLALAIARRNIKVALVDLDFYVKHRNNPRMVPLLRERLELLKNGWDPNDVFDDENLEKIIKR